MPTLFKKSSNVHCSQSIWEQLLTGTKERPLLLLSSCWGAHKGNVSDRMLSGGGERFQSALGSGPPQNSEGAEQAQRYNY